MIHSGLEVISWFTSRSDSGISSGTIKIRDTKEGDRWRPRYEKRPIRSVRFVSIKESVPDLEALTLKSMIHYTRQEALDGVSIQVRDIAGQVLNKAYANMHRVTYRYGGRRSIGVTTGGLTYAGVCP